MNCFVPCEPTVYDSQEQEDVQQFFLSNTCKCCLGPGGKPCCLSLSMETIQRSRDKCAELSHNELDLVMAQIHYLRTVEHKACQGKTSTFWPSCSYFIHPQSNQSASNQDIQSVGVLETSPKVFCKPSLLFFSCCKAHNVTLLFVSGVFAESVCLPYLMPIPY